MVKTWFIIFLGILGGIAVGIQSPIAGSMSQRIGGAASSLVVHLSGAMISGVLLWFRNGEEIRKVGELPWYMLASGIFGVVLYLTLSQTVPNLGASTAVSLIIVGQLLAGMLIDQFGILGVVQRPIDASRMLAVFLLAVGGYLMVR